MALRRSSSGGAVEQRKLVERQRPDSEPGSVNAIERTRPVRASVEEAAKGVAVGGAAEGESAGERRVAGSAPHVITSASYAISAP